MKYSDEDVALCALNKNFGYRPREIIARVWETGNPVNVFQEAGLDARELDWARQELEKTDQQGFRFIGLSDEDYPEALAQCEAPPLGIYLNGSSSPAEIFGLRPMVAVVGTRDISPYGKDWTVRLVQAMASAPISPCIVSGLALGTDGIAHRTALECGLPTLGVMATGIDRVYPWQHQALAMQMVRTPGCGLVTDYPLGTSPVALNFVRRNRIIAGLVRGVIVVESKTRGGSLMTAKYACEYNREVFALPGRADDLRSAGCNSLIHEHMAEIITTPEDLVFHLGLGGSPRRGAGGSWATGPEGFRNALERKYGPGSETVRTGMVVYEQRGIGPEELSATLDLPYPRVLELIGLLEADGFLTTDLLRRCTAVSLHR